MKTFFRWLPIWLSFLVLAASVVMLLYEPAFLTTNRNGLFDSYQKWKPRVYQSAPVRVLDIDDESLERVGQWPWSRLMVAELVDRLRDLGAAAVVFDMVFAEPDRLAPGAALKNWIEEPGVRDLVERLPEPDRAFAQKVGEGRVVTGFVLNQDEAGGSAPAAKGSLVTAGDDPTLFLPSFSGSVNSLPDLEAASDGNGALNVAPSRDGVVRRVQLLLSFDGKVYPTLTAEAIRVARGGSGYVVKSSGASGESRFGGKTGIVSVRIADVPVATNPQGAIWLHFTPQVEERSISAWRLLEDQVDREQVEGTIVFVGTSAAGLKDLRFNPLGNVTAGAEMHAQAVEQILQGTYLNRPDWATAAEVLFMIGMWLLLVFLILRVGALSAAAIGLTLVAVSFVGSWIAFSEMRLLLDPVYPAGMSVAVFLVCQVSRQRQVEREKRWIHDAFSSYISPNLVQYLVDNPDALNVGGEKRECSFVLSDLKGFTSLVEQSSPDEVVALLNEYLEGMVKVALGHDGTLDRIVGDAVAVMFSAPVTQLDHQQRAVDCALEMDAFTEEFRKRKNEEGLPVGITRIGVNTGSVTIGNVGGDTFFDYRALGDAINTAARLETVNGQIGTRVCVAESTRIGCEGFTGRPVGALVLKGKIEGVQAYEPLSESDASSQATLDYLEAYRLLDEEDPGAKEAFQTLVEAHPEDGLAAFHLWRLDSGQTGTRVTFTSK